EYIQDDLNDEHAFVASATECTGLVPGMGQDRVQAVEETRLYAVHPPEIGKENKCRRTHP
ncbi:MAG: hypothetical protein Q4F27_01900, partial [Desulfovibrionaceae bacterium]|nr:hypothetical protein [Desulfovibrionaceae bacterium]